MSDDRERGAVGVQYVVVLFFLAAATGAAALAVASAISYERRSEASYRLRSSLEKAALAAVKLLEEDATGEADGPGDPIWTFQEDSSDGIRREVRDLSSALDANFVRKALFEKTKLGELLIPGKTAEELQQYREDNGLSPFDGAYVDFFTEEAFRESITGYGWANINITDEFALRKLAAEITGSEAAAETLHAKVQQLLSERKILSRAELPFFLGTRTDELFPFMNVEPAMNVHFVDPVVLREILGYPDYHLPAPTAVADAIRQARSSREIRPSDLPALLGVNEGHILLQYFGCRTWFWEVSAEKNGAECVLVVAAIPELSALSVAKRTFRVIETRFEP